MKKRFILTGAPGSGKTTVAEHLRWMGHDIVAESATSVIADAQASGIDAPWEQPDFAGAIAALQRAREAEPTGCGLRFSDRSLFCTLALLEFLGRPIADDLAREAGVLASSEWFQRRVFFIEQLGFIENTTARRISLEEARRFGDVHADVYRRFGFQLIGVPPLPVEDRAGFILREAASQA